MERWKPDEELANRACSQHALDRELARCIAAEELAHARRKRSWPEGATAGLLLVAFGCIALGAALYQFTSPREPIEQSLRQ